MRLKPKIKIVTGSWGPHVMVGLWQELSPRFEIEFLVLESSESSKVRSSLPVRLFPNIVEMQGFYRDLELYLKGADLVVAIEPSRLGSFQALRCAKAMDIPIVVFCHEYSQMFYEKYANIRAIMFDISQNADHFVCTSRRSARLILSEGVSEDKISRLSRFHDLSVDEFNQAGRNKFRQYIGIHEDQYLIVARSMFDSVGLSSAILAGFKGFLSKMRGGLRPDMKLLLIGQGENLETLKYEAADFGLGSNVIFMAQDPSAFWIDVVSAADVVVWDRTADKQKAESYPFEFVQSLTGGVQNVVASHSIFDEVAVDLPVVRITELAPLDIAESLKHCFDNKVLAHERNPLGKDTNRICVEELEVLLSRLTSSAEGPDLRQRVETFVDAHQSPLTSAQARAAAIKLEELLLLKNLESEMLAELWRIKGDVLSAAKDTDKAIHAYEKALQIDPSCFRANRGLGYLAWYGHSHEDAMIFFKRALANHHNDYHCLVGIGLIYRRLKLVGESMFWLGRAVDIGGADSASLSLLVQACLESPESDISLTTLEHLRESFGDKPLIIRGLSQVYLAQGMSEKAAPLLEQACA